MRPVKILFTMALTLAFMSFTTSETTSTLSVDTSKSTVKWKGYHLAKSYAHWGEIGIKSGSLEVADGKITGGEFVIDMNSISVTDLEKEKDNQKLVGHLKSEDFFHSEKYPEATLKITSITSKGGNEYDAKGDLNVRGISNEISFTITASSVSDSKVEATAKLKVDRSVHKVLYGWSIENAVISNEFDLDVNIVASK